LQGISRQPPAELDLFQLTRWLNGYLGTTMAPWEWARVSEWWITQALVVEETQRQLAEVGRG